MILFRSFSEVQEALKKSTFSCADITKNYLKRISNQSHLNAFIEVYTDEALAQAKIVDHKIKNGTAGKLAGMVIGIKDNLCYKNHKVSAASKILDGFDFLSCKNLVLI